MTKRALETSELLLETPVTSLEPIEHFTLESEDEEEDELHLSEEGEEEGGLPGLIRPGDYADSECSSDEEEIRNRVGNIPMEWYDDYDHIGYDVHGGRVVRSTQEGDQLDKLLDRMDNPDYWRTVRNRREGEEVVLQDEDIAIIDKLRNSKYPDLGYDPYEPYLDIFSHEKLDTPLVDTPEPKRRFLPSKHEHKKVVRLIRAIRNGWMKPKEEGPRKPVYYDLWGSSRSEDKKDKGKMHIPAPKLPLPGTAESYNPPQEYLPSTAEIEKWNETEEIDRPQNFLSQQYTCLRHVPAYPQLINEKFDRCLDLYLCPRKMKMKLNMDPDDLLPRLPKPRDLKPFPSTKSVQFSDHHGPVYSVDANKTGEFLVSGGEDKVLRIWEASTGRILTKVALPDPISCVKWNRSQSMVAASSGKSLYILNPGLGDRLAVEAANRLLQGLTDIAELEHCKWYPLGNDKDGLRLKITHSSDVTGLTWHAAGSYLAVTMTQSTACPVLIHNLTKRSSQKPFNKAKGQIQQVEFHPSKPFLFVLSQRYVRVYNLVKQTMVRKLLTSVKWASCMAIHPKGDNVIVGSFDKTLVWFDMDLSVKPYKSLVQHKKAIRSVSFHPRYPLFATSSDDLTTIITHGMVYNDLVKNPLVVPVKVLRGHVHAAKYGVLSNVFHPQLPWIYTAGADGNIHLYT